MGSIRAVFFDFSGTLFRLEEDDGWFEGMELSQQGQAELLARLTHPTQQSVDMTDEIQHAWRNRDLAANLHREAYLHVLRGSGLADPHTHTLYERVIDPDHWTPYPDTATVLGALRESGVHTTVVSNIAWDVRPAFTTAQAAADEFVLSFEVGVAKPDPRIFQIALDRCGIPAHEVLMVGDSEENDGAAQALGCHFLLVDPLPVAQRPTALVDGLRAMKLAV